MTKRKLGFITIIVVVLVVAVLYLLIPGERFVRLAFQLSQDIEGEKKVRALNGAAARGDIEEVRRLINEGVSPNAVVHMGGPLKLASEGGHREIVELLLEKGARINERGHNNRTALIWACGLSRLHVAELLIDKGADMEIKDASSGRTALMKAAVRGQRKVMKLLIEKGADVNTGDKYGYAPLIPVSGCGDLEMVEILIEKGADVNAQAYNGKTALKLAVDNKHQKVSEVLMRHGAKK